MTEINEMENYGHRFRLHEISKIKDLLQSEVDKRKSFYSKYKKIYNILQSITITSGALSGGSSIVTLSLIANPITGIPSASVSAILGSVSLVTGIWSRYILKKVEKHDKIKTIARSKLDSINELVSKAYIDNKIDDEEFAHVLNEFERYQNLKNELKFSSRVVVKKEKDKERATQ